MVFIFKTLKGQMRTVPPDYTVVFPESIKVQFYPQNISISFSAAKDATCLFWC